MSCFPVRMGKDYVSSFKSGWHLDKSLAKLERLPECNPAIPKSVTGQNMLEGGRGVLKVKHGSPDAHFAGSQFSPGLGRRKTKPSQSPERRRWWMFLQASQTRPGLTEPPRSRAGVPGLLVRRDSGRWRAKRPNPLSAWVTPVTVGLLSPPALRQRAEIRRRARESRPVLLRHRAAKGPNHALRRKWVLRTC